MDFIFDPQPAVDVATARLVNEDGISGSVYASEADAIAATSPLTVTVAGGITTTNIIVSSFGLTAMFIVADLYQVWWRSGDYIARLLAFDSIVQAVEANAASSAASASAAELTAEETATLRRWIELGVTRYNLAPDPRLTTTALVTAGATVVDTRPSTGAPDGGSYFRRVMTTANTSSPMSMPLAGSGTFAIPVTPGLGYTVSWYARKTPSGGPDTRADWVWWDEDGVQIGTATGAAFTPGADWARFADNVIAPAGAAYGRPNLVWTGIALADQILDFAQAQLEDGDVAEEYHDGSYPTTDFVANRWQSGVNASVSEQLDMSALINSDSGGGEGGTTATWSTLEGKPSTFPPSGHTHFRSEISDATVLARQILGALTPQDVRALIGAGTGNGTSNLVLGTTATTAAPGNHAHAQYVDSAQAADIADDRIALSGGGSGGGSIMAWIYRSGAYPALPASQPLGLQLILAKGPVAPSVLPSWVGNGPSQVPTEYTYGPLT